MPYGPGHPDVEMSGEKFYYIINVCENINFLKLHNWHMLAYIKLKFELAFLITLRNLYPFYELLGKIGSKLL